jgi:hypothetical protein
MKPENLKEAIGGMDKAISCLYLELPASIVNDVRQRFDFVKEYIQLQQAPKNCGRDECLNKDCDTCDEIAVENWQQQAIPQSSPPALSDALSFAEWIRKDWIVGTGDFWRKCKLIQELKTTEELYQLFKEQQAK